ncbi:unnamed protein product [Musa acuminata subsp. malaccensis]|uniref:4-coumarate--CoA ligase n=1 Tax=Musa acuminata subsp. malaccensis TaxID=214687 RepID=A0A8D7BFC0_MUSAM|nr:unnamed protein product [Musa acuminata subsp. malaccensis]
MEAIPRQSPTSGFFSPETGIYRSKHRPAALPQDPFVDLVSYVFSFPHQGVTALVDSRSGASIAYAELRGMVRSLAAGLSRDGITSKDVVLVMIPNSILFPVVFLGVLSVGAVFSTMNPLSSAEEIKKQMSLCRFTFIFTVPSNVAKLGGLGVKIVTVPEEPEFDAHKFVLFNSLISSDPNDAPRPVIRQTDAAAILFSSGTTGASKGVVLTHRNLIATVELFVRSEASLYGSESWRNVYLTAIPMFHVYGLSLFSMGLLSLGSTIVVMRKFDVEETVRAIDAFKVTHFPAVPPIMTALIRAKGATGCRLQSLVQVSCGAAPIAPKTIHDFLKAFPHVDFIQGYGLTESAAVGTRGFNTINCRRHISVGLLAPNMQAKIIDLETGSCLPPGTSGELLLHGAAIMKGKLENSYLNDDNATSSAIIKDGWLKTGDIAYFDGDGYLYISDRLKETIKYKGFQIAPADLEALLNAHPDIVDAAVTAAKNEEAGEIPVAFVVTRSGSKLSSTDVIEFVAKQVTPYKKVREVIFVNSIPRSPAGKTLRRELRDTLAASRM